MTTSSHPRPDRWREVTPDDRAHDDAAHEFWGDKADWSTPRTGGASDGRSQSPSVSHDRRGKNPGRWRGLLTGARIAPTRTHAADSVGPQDTADNATHEDWPDQTEDTFEDAPDETWDERWETTSPPAPASRSGVDPLLARFGGLAVIVTLLIPAFLGFTSDSDETDVVRTASAPLQIPAPPAVVGSTADAPVTGAPSTSAPTEPAATMAQEGTIAPGAAIGTAPGPATSVSTSPTEPTVVTSDAVVAQALTAPSCPQDYAVVAGDYWIRIADASGTSLDELLDLNDATLDTALFPGRSICLPAGAAIPAPPTTAPPTTAPPTTAPPTRAATGPSNTATARPATRTATPTRPASTQQPAPTTRRPATPRPATPQPAPPSLASPAEVEAIIRAVWPDDLESRAIEIAQRESKLSPTARNSCCYGLFQIYWSVHKNWLAGLGITSAEQLYDPTLNARAALALYERAGSWGPWGS